MDDMDGHKVGESKTRLANFDTSFDKESTDKLESQQQGLPTSNTDDETQEGQMASSNASAVIVPSPDFAPTDLTDGREVGKWQSRYTNKKATDQIQREAGLVLAVLLCSLLGIALSWYLCIFKPILDNSGLPTGDITKDAMQNIQAIKYAFCRYVCTFLGGTIGGCLFSLKWLYHTVAKGTWNQDRFLWRVFTPLLSGTLAFFVFLLLSSGIGSIINSASLSSLRASCAMGFLIGYFSDSAIAKLSEVADTLFGRVRKN